MSIQIKTYPLRPSNVYHGGETVTGFLEIHGPIQSPNCTIKCTLTGQTHATQHLRNRTLTDTQTLFRTPQTLYQGPISLPTNEQQTYPFTFPLPSLTDPPTSGNKTIKLSKKTQFYAQESHPLPPSCAVSGGLPHAWEAQVVYRLDAEISGKGLRSLKQSGVIDVVMSPSQTQHVLDNANTSHEAQSKTLTYTSSQLLSSDEGSGAKKRQRRSVSTWLSDKFSPTSPKAVFNFTALTATILSPGQEIPIQLTLNYNTEASNLPTIPPFNLIELKYKIKAHTHSVARGTLAPDLYLDDTSTVFKRTMRFANMQLADGEVVDVGYIDTENGGIRYLALDTALVTGFMTYNISRHYGVEIGIVVLCGGKEMKAQFGWENVDVVFNEEFHLRAATQLVPADGEGNLQGAVGVAKVVGVTALAIASILGG